MPVCNKCRHEFDVGRFCTNCGHPVDAPVEDLALWRTDTAERPAVTGASVPPASEEVAPRFPLYVDEVTTDAPAREPRSHRRERLWLPWAIGALALLLVASLGAWLLLDDDSEPESVANEPTNTPVEKAPRNKPSKPTNAQKNTTATKPERPADVTAQATVAVPATAEPSIDFDGNVIGFQARNMLDGVPTTCWRMPGDGSGETITLELPRATRLTSVGLINGYAKTDADDAGNPMDWYAGNRRILAVAWKFDDGTVVTQDLTETRQLQTTPVDPVTTSTVELSLVTVTEPGTGPARRDYTAISDVALVGSAA